MKSPPASDAAVAIALRYAFFMICSFLAHKETDEILGVHMVGPRVSELIAEAVAVMEFRGSAEDLARTCHAHPTLSEVVMEAAHGAVDQPIHIYQPKS